jgi:DNA-binding transcriptional ArsR family regulator
MANPYGDIELDARGMRALAHPVRLEILTRLQQDGPSTATRLSEHVGATPSVTSWHLRHLARHGLVRDADVDVARQGTGRERWWQAAARGFRIVVEDEAGRRAAHALRSALDATEGDPVGAWRRDVEPRLDLAWLTLAGLSDTTVLVTRDELREIEESVEQLLAPYVLRKDAPAADVPGDARQVRIRRHVLPDGDAPA